MAYEAAGKETPCGDCRPELKKVNEPYVILYYYCQDQYIMGPQGPVALDMRAINQAMDDYNIDPDERIEFSTVVRRIANIIFSAQAKKHADEMRRKK